MPTPYSQHANPKPQHANPNLCKILLQFGPHAIANIPFATQPPLQLGPIYTLSHHTDHVHSTKTSPTNFALHVSTRGGPSQHPRKRKKNHVTATRGGNPQARTTASRETKPPKKTSLRPPLDFALHRRDWTKPHSPHTTRRPPGINEKTGLHRKKRTPKATPTPKSTQTEPNPTLYVNPVGSRPNTPPRLPNARTPRATKSAASMHHTMF